MTSPPRATIGIPTYNRASLLGRAIESALRQGDGVEVVISDNASTDATPEICAEVVRRDDRVRYLRQPRNVGALGNFAATLAVARGRYFMWLGDDDWLDDGYVRECAAVLDRSPGHSLVGGRAHYYEHGGTAPLRADAILALEQESPSDRVLGYFASVGENGIFYGLSRTEQLRRIQTDGGLAADWIHVALLAVAGRVRTIDDVHINRTVGGVSGNAEHLTAFFGITGFFARPDNLWALIAWRVYSLLSRREELRFLGPLGRQQLALAAARVVLTRHYGHMLRSRLRLRSRAKGAVTKGLSYIAR